jgi:hypothetical protein
VLRRGGPDAARRARELRGDIDTIVAKALRKRPAERYANAAELAEDLRRTLAHEPIAARPAGWWYLGSRFLRRHRVGVAAAAVALAAVLGGASVAVLEAREARHSASRPRGCWSSCSATCASACSRWAGWMRWTPWASARWPTTPRRTPPGSTPTTWRAGRARCT